MFLDRSIAGAYSHFQSHLTSAPSGYMVPVMGSPWAQVVRQDANSTRRLDYARSWWRRQPSNRALPTGKVGAARLRACAPARLRACASTPSVIMISRKKVAARA